MISIIACVGKNLELGLDNKLIFHLKKDMEFFKKTTTNHIVVMGRKTYESIGKPLPNRENIVITSKKIDGVRCTSNINDILNIKDDVFIIGGASIYKTFLPYASKIYLTEVEKSHKADVYFPYFDKSKYKKEVLSNEEEKGIKYSFVIYYKSIMLKEINS